MDRVRLLSPIQRIVLLALLYVAGSLFWFSRLLSETRTTPAGPAFTLPPDPRRLLQATVPRDAQHEAIFTVPFGVATLEKTRQLRCLMQPARDLSRCLVQVIVEADHHYSYAHTYRCAQLPKSGFAFTIPFSGEDGYWKSLGHTAPWSRWDRTGLRRIHVKVFFADPVTGTRLDLRYQEDLEPAAPTRLTWSRAMSDAVVLGARFELAFDIDGWHGNPFNYVELPVVLDVVPPGGVTQRVRPFLFQDFEAVPLLDKEVIRPTGSKQFHARYRPLCTGTHRYRLLARDKDGGETLLHEGQFEVTDGTPPRFLRVSRRSPRFFETSTGQFVYLIGWNLPYPVDRPYGEEYVPYLPTESTLAVTRKMLDDLADSGGNFIRFWLSDWWNGLEWNKDVDNYSGIGRYNLKHAWMNDQIMDYCEERGIYMQWETLNHVRLKTDYGWPKHPYNVRNGGFLTRGKEFWTHPEARQWGENRLSYIAARYADSPAIHSWNLMSEPDQVSARWGVWNEAKAMLIQQMQYMQQQDIYHHITSSHMCLPDQDVSLFMNDTLQFVNSNAYQGLGGLSGDQIQTVRDFADRYNGHGRPMLIAECVGYYAGDPAFKMRRDTLGALWAGIASNLAGVPLSWWWNFNYGEDMGRLYRIAADFMNGEDLIAADMPPGAGWLNRPVQVTSSAGNLRALMVGNATRRFLFAYNFDTLSRTRKLPSRCKENRIGFGEMQPGEYRAIYWDVRMGRSTNREDVTVGADGMAMLTPPTFTEGWAVKIVPRGDALADALVPHAGPSDDVAAAAAVASPVATLEGGPAAWAWALQPQADIVTPEARPRSLLDVSIALPDACRGFYPRVTDVSGRLIPCAWQRLENGLAWRVRIPAALWDGGELKLAAVSDPVTNNLAIDEGRYGLTVAVAARRTSWLRSRTEFTREFGEFPWKRQTRVESIDQLENPLGANEDFLALYQGPLLIPCDGDYEFGSNADDASYVVIDGQEIVGWTAGQGMDVANRPMANLWRHHGRIHLRKGIHWVEYGHRQARGSCLARLGWTLPASMAQSDAPWAQPVGGSYDLGFNVVPGWAFDGVLPCRVVVLHDGRAVAALDPGFGLELRRPATRIYTLALVEGQRHAFRFFADGGRQVVTVGGQSIPVWVGNAYWRQFSLEWERCVNRRNEPMLKTMLYDIDMPLSVTFSKESPVAKFVARRAWAGWQPQQLSSRADFVIAAGGVPLVQAALEVAARTDAPPGKATP